MNNKNYTIGAFAAMLVLMFSGTAVSAIPSFKSSVTAVMETVKNHPVISACSVMAVATLYYTCILKPSHEAQVIKDKELLGKVKQKVDDENFVAPVFEGGSVDKAVRGLKSITSTLKAQLTELIKKYDEALINGDDVDEIRSQLAAVLESAIAQ